MFALADLHYFINTSVNVITYDVEPDMKQFGAKIIQILNTIGYLGLKLTDKHEIYSLRLICLYIYSTFSMYSLCAYIVYFKTMWDGGM